MKRYINLLPKEAQKEIALDKLAIRLVRVFLVIFGSLLVFIALLIVGRLWLQGETDSLQTRIDAEQSVVSKQDNQQLKNQLNRFNTDLSNLVDLEQHHAQWSEVLVALARLIPSDVAIDSLTADRQTYTITISGLAKKRESVLQLRQNILNSSYFTNVNFPLSNITKPTDVNFHYTFHINPNVLIPYTAPR